MMYNYIVIEGCIGAGKTTLSKMLASDLNGRLVLEQFEDNSFLPKFYKDPAKYAFPLELSFLAERYQQLKHELSQTDLFHEFTLSDYFLQKSLIFARATLQEDEYNLYSRLFHIIHPQLPEPDLIVYLYATTERLMHNIERRGRDYERSIPADYLERIQNGYLEYFRRQSNKRILIIDTNQIDFVASQSHYEWLRSVVNQYYDAGIHRIVADPTK